ncbi:MAG: DNA-binding MarR family transcriptional regulator [Sediminicola sp.]
MLPIYSISRFITKVYKPYLDDLGLTYPQYLVLMVLWKNNELAVSQISGKLLLNTNTLSPLLKRIEKMKLLERNRSSKDERSVTVLLTQKGKQLKTKALPIPEKLIKTLISEDIKMSEIIQLKETLNEWIKLLTKNTKD